MLLGLRQRILKAAAVSLILVAGSGAAFAQGRGHGGDKGGHGGGNGRGQGKAQQQQQQQDRGKRGEQRRERQQMPQPRFEQRQQRQKQGRQQVFMGPPIREQQFPGRGGERKNERADRGRREVQAPQQYEVTRRREDSNRRNEQRQGKLSYDRTPRDNDRRDRSQLERIFQQQIPSGGFYGYKNYGQYRSQQVHERNADRKAWKNADRNLRRDRSSVSYYNGDTRVDRDRDSWHENFLRNIIAFVRPSSDDRSRSYDPRYGQGYYAQQQVSNYPYQSYASAPVYYPNYDSSYDQQYGSYSSPYYSYISEVTSGNEYMRDTYGRLVAVGYEQGYADGLVAARTSNANYYDPYVYNQTTYDPYSSSLGVDRRYLSDGYGLGYQDAVDGDYAQDQSNNNQVDLVSLLLSTALQMFS